MTPKFIEVHAGEIFTSINIDHIIWFRDHNLALLDVDNLYIVTETYDELKALILDAGYFIQQTDPRLDAEKPLTLDDLKDMVGEPVWDSNLRKWWLVSAWDENFVVLRDSEAGVAVYIGDKLIAKPLYRMKG